MFTIDMTLAGQGRDMVNMHINLVPHRSPGLPNDGMLDLFHHNRHQAGQPIDKKHSLAICRSLAIALANYRLPPSTLASPGRVAEKLTISISGGELSHGSFCFIRADSAQWKKAGDFWNALRAMLPPANAGDLPTL
ncbi:hypothetical protein [Chthoniobacter flavus]|uniref:hypothetical protein n=1 Tax=Chthoniobacter flavus TaxID=191863 RepID=UPI0002D88929|nr:hypothetical protein [Chthoniobacter flavus]